MGKELKFHIDSLYFSGRKVMLESYIGRFQISMQNASSITLLEEAFVPFPMVLNY